jgi:hypothetical protein
VRGVQQLTAAAVTAAGIPGDPADVGGWQPRFSPLWINWRYLSRSVVGGFEEEQDRPRHGSGHLEALFAVSPQTPEQGFAPVRWEDRGGRHLWWRFWGELLPVGELALLLPCLLLAAAAGLLLLRSLRTVGFRDSR